MLKVLKPVVPSPPLVGWSHARKPNTSGIVPGSFIGWDGAAGTALNPQYLLRFDDICPTMNWDVWSPIEEILDENGIRPILAVVPDNKDPDLEVRPPYPLFWDRIREWQGRGWSIAMHGWQHRFVTAHGGLLGSCNYSEFAGLLEREQAAKLNCGREVFEREGVKSNLWIAPAHSFDAVTVSLLRRFGFRYISDGFSFLPHVDRHGMTWIPQQLCEFRARPFGVWTISFHMNHWEPQDISVFRESVSRYRGWIDDLDRVVRKYGDREKSLVDGAAAGVYRSLGRARAAVKHVIRSSSSGQSG